MRYVNRLNNLNDCVAAIRKQLEMIDYLSDSNTLSKGVKSMTDDCDRMTKLFTELYDTVKPEPEPEPVGGLTDNSES